jgi:hypothetical protein
MENRAIFEKRMTWAKTVEMIETERGHERRSTRTLSIHWGHSHTPSVPQTIHVLSATRDSVSASHLSITDPQLIEPIKIGITGFPLCCFHFFFIFSNSSVLQSDRFFTDFL